MKFTPSTQAMLHCSCSINLSKSSTMPPRRGATEGRSLFVVQIRREFEWIINLRLLPIHRHREGRRDREAPLRSLAHGLRQRGRHGSAVFRDGGSIFREVPCSAAEDREPRGGPRQRRRLSPAHLTHNPPSHTHCPTGAAAAGSCSRKV